MGSNDAVSPLSPRAVSTCGSVARAWRSLCWWRRVYGGWRAHGEPRRFTIRHGEHGSAPACGRSQSGVWVVGGGVGGAWMGCAAQSFCSGPKGFSNSALLARPHLPRVPATAGQGGWLGGGGGAAAPGPCFAGGRTVVQGGGYWGDCVGGARTVCAALSSNLYGLSSCLMGSNDAVSPLSPRAVSTCGSVARAWRSLCWWRRVYGGWRAHGEPRRFTIRHGEHGSAPACGRSQSGVWVVGGGVGGAWMGCAAQSFCSGPKGFSNSALLARPHLPRVPATAAPEGWASGGGGTGGVTAGLSRA